MSNKNFLCPFFALILFFFMYSGAQATLIDFDALAPGTPVTTIEGVTFSSNTGLDLIVSNIFDAASGDNYLGVDDDWDEVFLPFFGDVITLDFAEAITSLTVSFVSTPFPPTGSYSISTLLGNAVSQAIPDFILDDDGEVFTVMFESATPFMMAELSGGIDGVHSFNIDDIQFTPTAVPEPTTLALLGIGILILLIFRGNPRDNAKI
ncbi:MAG: hypothetical protein AMJ53_10550 [Gammaproteobacteria bacterium SG8_11]|nr:MAG: hypothetical protein AMJ53_10550 [Gammaproteobacteria bacterium SG8_11]